MMMIQGAETPIQMVRWHLLQKMIQRAELTNQMVGQDLEMHLEMHRMMMAELTMIGKDLEIETPGLS
jgi:hypothetical protein